IIGHYMLNMLKLEEDFSLDEIQENNDSFLLDINESEGIIARVNFSTIIQETGFVTGYIAVLHDVTEQQQVEQERREFVANVSHELRTPLTSMNSYIEVNGVRSSCDTFATNSRRSCSTTTYAINLNE